MQLARFAVAVVLLAGLAAGADAAEPRSLRVLFVGNSLTATNDLPRAGRSTRRGERQEARAPHGRVRRLQPRGSLERRRGPQGARVRPVGRRGHAAGPSAFPESQADLRLWATRLAGEARSHGTRPALLTVWPESWRQDALPEVIKSYSRAAAAAGAELLPAGVAWQLTWRCNARVPLYGEDDFHPSPTGTYAAALVVYGRLFRAPLRTRAMERSGVPGRTSRLLQAAAARALGRRLPPRERCGR